MKFGYEGLGLFYTTLEKFAAQEKPVNTVVLKKQLNIGKRLERCWKFMEEIGIISSSNGDSFNEQLLNFAGSYQIKKEKTAKRVAEWRLKHKEVTCYERVSNAPKVKLSKVKLSKDIDKTQYLEFVLLTPEEHERLEIKLNGQLESYIQRLNNYIGSKGVKYKSHYHTILSWAAKDNTPIEKKVGVWNTI
jgi:tRNA U34 5-carboxymethylaminomethyl modifying enzyme MnmG/GidA